MEQGRRMRTPGAAVFVAPAEVVVFPHRREADGTFSVHLQRRAINTRTSHWVGAERMCHDDETPCETAMRAAFVGVGLSSGGTVSRLRTSDTEDARTFRASQHWPADVEEVPRHFFGVDAGGADVRAHHGGLLEQRWFGLVEAGQVVTSPTARTALSELHDRLVRGDLPQPCTGRPEVVRSAEDVAWRARNVD